MGEMIDVFSDVGALEFVEFGVVDGETDAVG